MYRYSLDKSSKKFDCPACGKKTFVKYMANETKQYIGSEVGRCDREINCGYHYSPKAFFESNKQVNEIITYPNGLKRNVPGTVSEQTFRNVSYIDNETYNKTLFWGIYLGKNNFIEYLLRIFDEEIVIRITERFRIGTSKYRNGATIFWQIDEKQNIRSGKIIQYDSITGKRSKNITWVHSVLKIPNYNLKQCLFGLHQLKNYPDHIIGIVESEKTAVIMTGYSMKENILNNYIWMATGSLNMLKEDMLISLKNSKIVLYPDLGINKNSSPYEIWSDKCRFFKKNGYNITISSLLEGTANENEKYQGFDLADFIVNYFDCLEKQSGKTNVTVSNAN